MSSRGDRRYPHASLNLAVLPLLAIFGGCAEVAMTGIYAAGEVNSIVQGRYRGTAVLELSLDIEGVRYDVRAPAGCRSFVHPTGGMRVTRTEGEIFEMTMPDGNAMYVRIPYSCGVGDASVSLPSSDFIRVYRVVSEPTFHLVADWPMPSDNPLAKEAPAKLISARVDVGSTRTTARITDRLRTGSTSQPMADTTNIAAVYAWQIPLKSPYVDAALASALASETNPVALTGDLVKPLLSRLNRERVLPGSYQTRYPEDAGALLKQVPFTYDVSSNNFDIARHLAGKRVYYPVAPPRLCAKPVDCRSTDHSTTIDSVKGGEDGLWMVYDPSRQVIYWRFTEWMLHAWPPK